MQSLDGWDFLCQMMKMPVLTGVPVVIISILADRTKGFALGAAAVMQKPISRQELFDSLVELGLTPRGDTKSLKILIVDDDRAAVELSASRLGGAATTILRAYGGQEGIEMARREVPDLIILDIDMPGVSGFDVVEALNSVPATMSIPIIVVTSMDLCAEDRSRLNGNVAEIIGKTPFDTERFLLEVRRATSVRSMAV